MITTDLKRIAVLAERILVPPTAAPPFRLKRRACHHQLCARRLRRPRRLAMYRVAAARREALSARWHYYTTHRCLHLPQVCSPARAFYFPARVAGDAAMSAMSTVTACAARSAARDCHHALAQHSRVGFVASPAPWYTVLGFDDTAAVMCNVPGWTCCVVRESHHRLSARHLNAPRLLMQGSEPRQEDRA
jgi:hypothetical protein